MIHWFFMVALCFFLGTSPARSSFGSEAPGTGTTINQASPDADETSLEMEADEEAEYEEDAEDDEDEDSSELTANGFIEFENFISTHPDQEFTDAFKKNEIRTRLEMRYGKENLYLFTTSDLYLNPDLFHHDRPNDYRYSSESDISRNLRITSSRSELSLNELYVNIGYENLRLRIGNQIYGWGTADVFNPTSYFNALDFREFFFRDDDELKQGVPSLSAMIFADEYTVELVVTLVHCPMLFAPRGNYWSLDMGGALYDLDLMEADGMDIELKNIGFGARVSTVFYGNDISLSGYHGPDREPVLLPYSINFPANNPISIEIHPQYHVIHMLGIDFSKTVGDFVFQFEAAYSPDKMNFVEQNLDALDQIKLPFKSRKANYISYATGFNYFVPLHKLIENHEGETVFTVDWFQSKFFDSELFKPYLTDLLTFRLEDSFWDGRLKTSFTYIYEARNRGSIFWPKIGYDFQNGFSVELAYAEIDGNPSGGQIEPAFYYFRKNDIVSIGMRYEY
ncbi:MAG: DUF1302 family protein [Desulfobacterales bacterium]